MVVFRRKKLLFLVYTIHQYYGYSLGDVFAEAARLALSTATDENCWAALRGMEKEVLSFKT